MGTNKNRFSQIKQHEYTKEMVEEVFKCSQDVIYFSKYITIVHPDPKIGKHLIKLRDYQIDLLTLLSNNDRVILMQNRQSAKTTTVCIYLFWYSIFNPDVTIGILAHKDSCAMSILSDIKMMYDELPDWLRPNYIEYNAHTLSFDNGSKIFCAATSPDALVGESITALYCDEFSLVPDATEFFAYNSATVSEGKQVIISSTPRGVGNLFHKFWIEASNGQSRFKPFRVDWWQVPGRDEKWKEATIKEIGPVLFASEYGNSFIGSQSTVLSSDVLKTLRSMEPITEEKVLNGTCKIYKSFNPNKLYIAAADLGLGTGADYSTLIISEVTTRKPTLKDYEEYEKKREEVPEIIIETVEQCLVFKTNIDNLTNVGTKIIKILNEWGNPYFIWEQNGISMTLVERLMNGDLEYENCYIHDNGKLGVLSGPSIKIKMIGCLKKNMELGKFIIHDADTIDEMMCYIEKQSSSGNKKFEGDGKNDDLIICIGWQAFLLDSLWLYDNLTYK
jgi:hypothetical protein